MVVASAPGKVQWIGSYAVLEKPNPCFVTTIDKRICTNATPLPRGEIEIECPQINVNASGAFTNGIVSLSASEETQRKVMFVKTAVQSTFAYLEGEKPICGVKIKTFSHDVFGSGKNKTGLGSSAAVTVATVAAVLALHNINDVQILHKIAQFSHCVSQGKIGSGFDVAASTFGSIEYTRFSPEIIENQNHVKNIVDKQWNFTVNTLKMPPQFECLVASTGQSASTTEKVKKVNAWKASAPKEYSELMKTLNNTDLKAISALKKLNYQWAEETLEKFKKHFNEARMITKELGEKSNTEIENDEMTQLIEESVENGAFVCRLPGAGGGDSIAALCLSVEDTEKLKEFWKEKNLQVLDVEISNEGVSLEKTFSKEKQNA